VIVLALTSGRSGLRDLWRRLTNWRVSWHWYLIGPAMVASFMGGAYALNLLLGASVTNSPQLPAMSVFLELLLLGGLWEEPGWTGYALPKLQERYARRPNGALTATLVMGAIRSIWHLPLLIYGHLYWFDMLVYSFALQVMISWLFNRSRGSVLVVMAYHFASNLIGGGIMFPVFSGAARTSYYALMVALASVMALVILWKSGLKLGQDGTQKTPAIADHQAA
jgi:membrane protease YdiL (CAAX protease family)